MTNLLLRVRFVHEIAECLQCGNNPGAFTGLPPVIGRIGIPGATAIEGIMTALVDVLVPRLSLLEGLCERLS